MRETKQTEPHRRPLRIMHVASEWAPFAKTGGLADVVAGLSSAQADCGHDVRVVLPDYPIARTGAQSPADVLSEYALNLGDGKVKYGWRLLATDSTSPVVHGLRCDQLFAGPMYGAGEAEAHRFILLCRAALDLCHRLVWYPDIIHCHDWHAALLPSLLQDEQRRGTGFGATQAILTIHNIGYQGVFPASALSGLPPHIIGELRSSGSNRYVNLLRSGIRKANAVTTVSPTYAREIRTAAFGMGLEVDLDRDDVKLSGILNGIDCASWNPAHDPHLAGRYHVGDLAGKKVCKRALISESQLPIAPDAPLVGVVSRLVEHKGIDLVTAVLPSLLLNHSLGCVVLGDGETRYVEELSKLAAAEQRIAFTKGYDEALAHRIIAGSDILLVPSRYEPCGLTQMYAMRYGTVPVVRLTGGLADTVVHFNPDTGVGTGSVFRDADVGGISWGLTTALDWYAEKHVWAKVVANGMATDFSWAHQALEYEKLYRTLMDCTPP
jgi:starch synthase